MTNEPLTPSATGTDSRRATINFAIFAAIAVTIGWVGIAFDSATGQPTSNSLGMGLWIVVPLVVAMILARFRPDGAGPLGLTPRFDQRARWFGLATALYPAVTALIVLGGIAVGVATLSASGSNGTSPILVAMIAVVPALIVKNTIEELTWRGYGTRTALATGMPRLASHIAVGMAWSLWHLPLYVHFMSRTDFRKVTSLSWPLFIPLFLGGVIASAVVLGELRLRTGSIWPGVVLHTVGGAVVNVLLVDGHLHFSGHSEALFSPAPNSLANIALFGFVGYLLLRQTKIGGTGAKHHYERSEQRLIAA